MRMKLHLVLHVAVLALTWTCWSVDAFKLTSSKKPQKQKNKNNQLFDTAKEKWNNQLGQPLHLECDEKNGEGIFQVRSEFHAKEKDRQYLWHCHTVATEPMTDCTWSNEINEFQGSLLFMCQSNFVINGISSTYDRKQQDRKWKIKCCRANNHFTRACKISESINRFGKPFFYTSKDECSDPGVMTGLASEINREPLKDREWKVLQCSYANQKSCKYKCNSIRSRGKKKRKHKHKSRKQTVHKEESHLESNSKKYEQQQHFGADISTHRKSPSHHHHSKSSSGELKRHNHNHKSHFRRDNHHTRHEKHFAHRMRHRHKENKDIDAKYERKPHGHRHHPHPHRNHVPVADVVESKLHESKQQSDQKPPPSPISNTKLAPTPGLARPVVPNLRANNLAYFPTPTENNPWLSTPGLLRPVPIQRQPRLLSTPPATNYMESSPLMSPSQPVNGPQIAPVRPISLYSNPTNLQQHQYFAQFYPALGSRILPPYYSYNRLSTRLGIPQTPFQLLRGITLHPQNAEFSDPKQTYDFFHPPYSRLTPLPLQDITSPNWLNALYRISSLQKSLPNEEDRIILQEALLTIVAHHLHFHVPSPLNSPMIPHIPMEVHNNDNAYSSLKRILGEQNLKKPLNVHIHLPGNKKENMHPGGTNFRNQHTADQLPEMHTRHTSHQETLNQKRLVQKINQLLSKLPKNFEVQSDIPRIKNHRRIKTGNHTIEQPNYSESVVSLIPAEAPSESRKDDKTKYIEALNTLLRNTEPL